MTSSPARIRERLKRRSASALPERYRRDDSGLTTLEWLLIVAAVAGLAALAVVLVTNVVDQTSEQIAGQSARRTAAQLAAQDITDEAVENVADDDYADHDAVNDFYEDKCDRLELIYGDIDLDTTWADGMGTGTGSTRVWTSGSEPSCTP
ncbi:MAG: hypothetical protein OXC06_05405 [Acidimicrobiaceae bacterium]|nr:hypothetical protein [Acidimicrobiaceae bacterium]